jgi:RNA polymerase sigma factor (sigma-70 family)
MMGAYVPDRIGWRGLLRRIAAATGARDPEDLLHAAFIKLEEYRTRVAVDNPNAFLVRAAINLAHDDRRRASSRNHIDCMDPETLVLKDDQPLQDEVIAARARLSRVHAALGQLSPRTREVFLMHRVEELKYREIAQRLGVTVSAVEKHVAKAALFLAERMKED